MTCTRCHHLPSARFDRFALHCYCTCHTMADLAPDLAGQLRGWLAIFQRYGCHVSPLVATAIKDTEKLLKQCPQRGDLACDGSSMGPDRYDNTEVSR